ncbi:MAG TPA: pilus assembly protein PilM [Candidatus Paceibacterota bacterium]
MSIWHTLIGSEPIAGLDISETAVRIVRLREEGEDAYSVMEAVEVPLPAGTIENGVVQSCEALTTALREAVRKLSHPVRRCVLSIPADSVYHKAYEFPQALDEKKIAEALSLTADFQLPNKRSDIYVDWEIAKRGGDSGTVDRTIPLASVRRSVVDAYSACLAKVGIEIIALETHPFSIARSVVIAPAPTLIITDDLSAHTAFVVVHGAIDTVRTLPKRFVTDGQMPDEIVRLQKFYTNTHNPIIYTSTLDQFSLIPSISLGTTALDVASWAAALGAALRGAIPRSKDRSLSLTATGTATAYQYRRAVALADFTARLSIILAAFFIASFAASFALVVSLQQRAVATENVAQPATTPSTATEDRFATLSAIGSTMAPIIRQFPLWSALVKDITDQIPGTITVSSISIPSPKDTIQISGVAPDRATLNAFRESFSTWQNITAVSFPIPDLSQNTNIPFQVSFTMTHPEAYYMK